MFCKNCGKELLDSDVFCPYCGSKIEKDDVKVEEEVKEEVKEEPKFEEVEASVIEEKPAAPQPKKPWCIFAKVAKILGIVSVATCWIPFMIGIAAGVPGIVFGILAKAKSPDKESQEMGKSGMVKSIIGSAVSIATYLILVIVLGVIAALAASEGYEYYY